MLKPLANMISPMTIRVAHLYFANAKIDYSLEAYCPYAVDQNYISLDRMRELDIDECINLAFCESDHGAAMRAFNVDPNMTTAIVRDDTPAFEDFEVVVQSTKTRLNVEVRAYEGKQKLCVVTHVNFDVLGHHSVPDTSKTQVRPWSDDPKKTTIEISMGSNNLRLARLIAQISAERLTRPLSNAGAAGRTIVTRLGLDRPNVCNQLEDELLQLISFGMITSIDMRNKMSM